jgi:hypothetical protein
MIALRREVAGHYLPRSLLVYRGFRFNEAVDEEYEIGSAFNHVSRGLSSWTTNLRVAELFATRQVVGQLTGQPWVFASLDAIEKMLPLPPNPHGLILKMLVEPKDILFAADYASRGSTERQTWHEVRVRPGVYRVTVVAAF